MPPATRQPRPPKTKTVAWRKWSRLNLVDSRTDIEDDELAWQENAILVGKGQLQIVPKEAASVATIAAGSLTLWGFTLNGNPVLISVNADGSITQITPAGVTTAVAGAGTLSVGSHDAHLTIWQSSPVLIIDPVKGYFSWNGVTFTQISAGITGTAIAVFEGRVWIAKNRTITYTAPNTFDDFTAGNGSGSTIITDDAFDGNVVALVSAAEELWIVGHGAIDAIANVVAAGSPPNVVTAFSITNIVTNLGTLSPHSVIGYFRALAFLAPFGVYALSGVTPQKLSEKLDTFFQSISLTDEIAAAVATVYNLQILLFLVSYTGSNARGGPAPLPMLIGFSQGKWFQGVQGTALRWITTILVNGVAQAWGTDGQHIYQLFGASASTAVSYKVQGKLQDFGASTTAKATLKVGFEFQASLPVNPILTVDSEQGSEQITADFNNQVIWVNNAGAVVTWINNSGASVQWVSQGLVLARATASQPGQYLGWTVQGLDAPYRIQALQFEVVPTREWQP